MIQKNSVLIIAVAIALATSTALAGVLHVGPGETYTTIQSAIDAAVDNDIIIVAQGTYFENIFLAGKAITLISMNRRNWAVVSQTIIDGGGMGATVTFEGSEEADCILSGFTITGGSDGGIQGSDCQATVSQCIVTENTKDGPGGGIHKLHGRIDSCYITENIGKNGGAMGGCDGTIVNCLISDNTGDLWGGLNNCDGAIVNCTIVNNAGSGGGGIQGSDGTITNCIIRYNSEPEFNANTASINYSCFAGGTDKGNIDVDPAFVDYTNGDFRLQLGSPCIDAGTNGPLGAQVIWDIEGNARYLDGDFDGAVVIDMGAYESPASEAGVISLWPLEFYFTAFQDGLNPAEKILTIRNSGGGTLEWTITETCDWLELNSEGSTSASEYDEVSIGVDITDLAAGDYSCELTISDPSAPNSPQLVSVGLHVEGPAIGLPQSRYDFFAAEDGEYPTDQILTITNLGGGTLNWQIEPDSSCQWLQVAPISGSITDQTDEVLLTVDTTGLVAGDYNCPLTVSAIEATNTPQTAWVHLHIGEELFVPSQYPTIQSAIDNSRDFDTIIVAPGTYYEHIDFGGRNIVITSADPDDPGVVSDTVIDAEHTAPVVAFSGNEPADCRLEGFTITGGYNSEWGGGIVGNGTGAGISDCIIEDNHSERAGAGIHGCWGLISNCLIRNNTTLTSGGALAACHGRIVNCVITGNTALGWETAAAALHNCDGQTMNCTIADNIAPGGIGLLGCDGEITNCIIWGDKGAGLHISVEPSYTCYPDGAGNGNIGVDPAFFFPDDYRLTRESPSVDAGRNDPANGLPATDFDGNLRLLDGDGNAEAVVDMGAYEYDRQAVYFLVSTQTLQFNAMEGEPFWQRQTFLIANGGAGALDWQITEDSDWLSVVPDTGSTGVQPEEVGVIVDTPGLNKGKYTCQLTISDPLAVNGPRHVNIILDIRAEGGLSVPARYATIQSAIDAATNGDTIIVSDGVYTGPGNRDIDFKGKAITLRSENGPENCIIDCQNAGLGFYFHNGEDSDSIVEGFTVMHGMGKTDGYIIQRYDPASGGAVHNYESSPTFINCRFIDNILEDGFYSYAVGAGMYNYNSSPTLIKCSFTQNRADRGAGMYNTGGSPVLINCIFSGNTATAYGGGICNDSNATATLINCTLVGNAARYGGGGIDTREGGMLVTNSILWDNIDASGTDESAQVYISWQMSTNFRHNCIAGWTGQAGGVGNIGINPLFVDPGYWIDPGTPQSVADDIWIEGDYHLKAEGWRWDSFYGRWDYDNVTSPCIDAGNPATPLGEELLTVPLDPTNDWGRNIRINMGVYGGTQEASIGPVNWALLADISNDRVVNMADLAFFAAHWLQTDCRLPGWCGGADFLRDGHVGPDDIEVLADDWLNHPWRSGPVAHWKFDGNYLDNTGDYNGSPIGDPIFVMDYFARVGSGALHLDGIDDYVQVFGYTGIAGGQSRTVCAWIKTHTPERIIIAWGLGGTPAGRWKFATNGAGQLRLEVGGGFIEGTADVCDGAWHYVAAVLANDGSPNINEVKLYVDGLPDKLSWNESDRVIATLAGSYVSIGAFSDAGFFEGTIDDVRIYDRALSNEEIAAFAP